jgi:hypothetical protein
LDVKLLSQDTSFDTTYRLSNSRQIIEVVKVGNAYSGQVISFTRTYVEYDKKEKEKSKLLCSKVSFSADTSEIIFNAFKRLESIPDMDKIESWSMGEDGVTYSIERATKDYYSVRSYWTPSVQNDSVPYKNEIVSLIRFLKEDLKIYRHYEAFVDQLPSGNYTDGFISMSVMKARKSKKKR